MSEADHLPQQVVAHYRIGPRLEAAWRHVFGAPMAGLATPEAGTTDAMWSDFSLTANLRGEDLAWQVARRATTGWPTLRGLRALDVGTGLGGTAVGLARLGAKVTAVDVNPDLLRLAAANAADHGVPVSFVAGDITQPGAVAGGPFDAVVAEDVLEHVPDARAAIEAMAGLLADGGLLMTTIPNGDAVPFVVADGHYLLPGLTLLRHRPDAVAYVAAKLPDVTYDVGNYHPWDTYAAWLDEAGMTVGEVERVDAEPAAALADGLAHAEAVVRRAAADPELPEAVSAALLSGWDDYADRVAAARAMEPPQRDLRLLVRAWRIYAWRGRRHRAFRISGPSAPTPERWRELGRRIPGLAAPYRLLRRRRSG